MTGAQLAEVRELHQSALAWRDMVSDLQLRSDGEPARISSAIALKKENEEEIAQLSPSLEPDSDLSTTAATTAAVYAAESDLSTTAAANADVDLSTTAAANADVDLSTTAATTAAVVDASEDLYASPPAPAAKVEIPDHGALQDTAAAAAADLHHEPARGEDEVPPPEPEPQPELSAEEIEERELTSVKWSEDQLYVLEKVDEEKENLFITGPAGAGKSLLIREIVRRYRRKYDASIPKTDSESVSETAHKLADTEPAGPPSIYVTAFTGCAAVLVNGSTVHSFFGVGFGDGSGEDSLEAMIASAERNQYRPDGSVWRIRTTRCVILDEISVCSNDLFAKLEILCRVIRARPFQPWGGILMIFCGDFSQLPPISQKPVPQMPELSHGFYGTRLPPLQLTTATTAAPVSSAASASSSLASAAAGGHNRGFRMPTVTVKRVRGSYKKSTGVHDPLAELIAHSFVCSKEEATKVLFDTAAWKRSVHQEIYLSQVFRQTDESTIAMMNRARAGYRAMTPEDIRKRQERVYPRADFDRYLDDHLNDPHFIAPTYLHPNKFQVLDFNLQRLAKIPQPEYLFTLAGCHIRKRSDNTVESTVIFEDGQYTGYLKGSSASHPHRRALDTLIQKLPIVTELRLKVGAQVMLVKNLCVKYGLSNGSRGVVIHIGRRLPASFKPSDLYLMPGLAKSLQRKTHSLTPESALDAVKRAEARTHLNSWTRLVEDMREKSRRVSGPLSIPLPTSLPSAAAASSVQHKPAVASTAAASAAKMRGLHATSAASSFMASTSPAAASTAASSSVLRPEQQTYTRSGQPIPTSRITIEEVSDEAGETQPEGARAAAAADDDVPDDEHDSGENMTVWVHFLGHKDPVAIHPVLWEGPLHSDMGRPARQWKEYVSVIQYPLILAYAITIHKCQGQTLPHAYVHLGSKIRGYGMAYVAETRVRSMMDMWIEELLPEKYQANPRVVEKEALWRQQAANRHKNKRDLERALASRPQFLPAAQALPLASTSAAASPPPKRPVDN